MLGTTVILALRSIRLHLLRSFLTILGIVIGVGAVVTMVTLGKATTAAVQHADIRARHQHSPGPPRPGLRARRRRAAPARLQGLRTPTAIAQQVAGVTAVAPQASATATAIYEGANWSTTVQGHDRMPSSPSSRGRSSARTLSGLRPRKKARARRCASSAIPCVQNLFQRRPRGRPAVSHRRRSACDVIGVLTDARAGGVRRRPGRYRRDADQGGAAPLHRQPRHPADDGRRRPSLFDRKRPGRQSPICCANAAPSPACKDDDFNIFDTKQISDTLTGTTTLADADRRRGRRDFADCRRDRHHEHHAGER